MSVCLSVHLSVCLCCFSFVFCLSAYLSVCPIFYLSSSPLPICLSPSFHLSVCQATYLSSVWPHICLSFHLSICPSVRPPKSHPSVFCWSAYMSACMFLFPSVYLSGHLSVLWLPICLSVHLSVCLCSHPSVLLPVCSSLSVLCLDAYLSFHLSICLLVKLPSVFCPAAYLFKYPFVCLPNFPSVSVCLSVFNLFMCVSNCPSVCLTNSQSNCQSTHLSDCISTP
jgi:hypothetical protein